MALTTLFWVGMNLLLWRAEFGGGRETVSEIPVEGLIQRVLTSADRSSLTITHHGERFGQLQWVPSILEEAREPGVSDGEVPEGMVRAVSGYALELDLSLASSEPAGRWRVMTRLELGTNLIWRSVEAKLMQRPHLWQVNLRTGDPNIRLRIEEGRRVTEQTYTPSDLAQLTSVLGPLQSLVPGGMSALTTGSLSGSIEKMQNLGVRWSAGNDWLRLGHHRVRAYRLRAQMLDRYEMVAYFSRAGELLKVTLPDGFVLTNEAVTALDHD